MTATATTHVHADDPIVVTPAIRDANRHTADVVAVAVHNDGDQEVLPFEQVAAVSSADMHVWHIVAVAYGYLDDDGTWTETDRAVRRYWTVTDTHGSESHYATRLEHQ